MKYLIAVLTLLVCCRAVACTINVTADDDVIPIIKQRGLDVPQYDTLCKKLKKAGAKLSIDVWTGPIADQSVAVVIVSVANGGESAFSSTNTSAAEYGEAGSVEQGDLVEAALQAAIKELMARGRIDNALAEVRIAEREHRWADVVIDRYRSKAPPASSQAH